MPKSLSLETVQFSNPHIMRLGVSLFPFEEYISALYPRFSSFNLTEVETSRMFCDPVDLARIYISDSTVYSKCFVDT